MNQSDYLLALENALRALKSTKTKRILNDYRIKFQDGLNDGLSEEEISELLGDPAIAASEESKTKAPPRAILLALDVFLISFFFILSYLILIAAALWAIASVLGGVTVTFNLPFATIPAMPRFAGIALGLALISLGILLFSGTISGFAFIKKLFLKYIRWHKLAWKGISTSRDTTPLGLSLAKRKNILNTMKFSAVFFVIFLAAAYAVFAVNANSLQFWHSYDWFKDPSFDLFLFKI